MFPAPHPPTDAAAQGAARAWRRSPSPAPSAAPTRAAAVTLPRAGAGAGAGAATTTRLNKRLADMGLCSRREGDEWIARGWVRVNGVVATLGQTVTPADQVTVARSAEQAQAKAVTVLFNKPLGVVSGQAEDGHRPAVTLINAATRWAQDPVRRRFEPSQLAHLVPAGRLDIDSTGLLVLTQDGRVARTLVAGDGAVEKEYLVRVAWLGQVHPQAEQSAATTYGPKAAPVADVRSRVPQAALARLRHGLTLDGVALRPAQVDWVNADQLRFVLREGRKRQIRRMAELVGLQVLALKRVRIGGVRLGDLPVGQWRYLGPDESLA